MRAEQWHKLRFCFFIYKIWYNKAYGLKEVNSMVQSLNSKVDLVMEGTSYLGLGNYGKIMIGDKAFEFYNDHNQKDYIQIPWNEIDLVIASLMFKGKWIPRFAIQTKHNGTYSFAARHPKKLLSCMQKYVDPQHIVRSLSFFQVIRRGIRNMFHKNNS